MVRQFHPLAEAVVSRRIGGIGPFHKPWSLLGLDVESGVARIRPDW
jgi:hypothetical protein